MQLLLKEKRLKKLKERKGKIYSIITAITSDRKDSIKNRELGEIFYSTYFVSIDSGDDALNLTIDTSLILSESQYIRCLVIDTTKKSINKLVGSRQVIQNSETYNLSERCFYIKINNFDITKFKQLSKNYDYVFIVTDYINDGKNSIELISEYCNSGILIVSSGLDRKPVVENTLQKIEMLNSKFLGVVLTRKRKYIPSILYNLLFKRRL